MKAHFSLFLLFPRSLSPLCFTTRVVILKRHQADSPSGVREVNFKATSAVDGGSAKKKEYHPLSGDNVRRNEKSCVLKSRSWFSNFTGMREVSQGNTCELASENFNVITMNGLPYYIKRKA